MENKIQLPEAPASVNFTYKRKDGFIVQLTLRDETGKEVLKRLDGAIAEIVKTGGAPYEKSFGKQQKPIDYVTDRKCPKCGNRLVRTETKKGKVIKCETNKFDFQTKTASGCPFVEWSEKANDDDPYAYRGGDKDYGDGGY